MSVEHNAPSTYILRELHDVAVVDAVSWAPQTVGWKVLAIAIVLVLFYFLQRRLKQWWLNRYRGEALAVIKPISESDANAGRTLFHVLSVVHNHLDSRASTSYGKELLAALDERISLNGTVLFNDELGDTWLDSLVNPRVQLSAKQVSELKKRAEKWLVEHRNDVQLEPRWLNQYRKMGLRHE